MPHERRRLGTPGSCEPRSSLAISPGWPRRVAQVGRVRTCTPETPVAEDYEAVNVALAASETDLSTALYRHATLILLRQCEHTRPSWSRRAA